MMEASTFQPRRLLETLEKHGVRYVLIGGMAAILHGSTLFTSDADLCPARDPENLERLARAMNELHARIRAEGVEGGLPFACDSKFLGKVVLLNLTTDAGAVDLAFEPSGTGGYDDLAAGLLRMNLEGLEVPVAALRDIIRSKTAANRPKDRAALPTLLELARQTEARSQGKLDGEE